MTAKTYLELIIATAQDALDYADGDIDAQYALDAAVNMQELRKIYMWLDELNGRISDELPKTTAQIEAEAELLRQHWWTQLDQDTQYIDDLNETLTDIGRGL